jgi:hypothetical protein
MPGMEFLGGAAPFGIRPNVRAASSRLLIWRLQNGNRTFANDRRKRLVSLSNFAAAGCGLEISHADDVNLPT